MAHPEHPGQPRPDDPYQAVWRMSDVGGTVDGKRHTELRIVPGLIAGGVVLLPFAILAGYLWAAHGAVTGGFVVILLGLAGGFSMGAFVASDRS